MIENRLAEHIRKYGNERRNLQRGGGKRAGYFGLDGFLIQPSGGTFLPMDLAKAGSIHTDFTRLGSNSTGGGAMH